MPKSFGLDFFFDSRSGGGMWSRNKGSAGSQKRRLRNPKCQRRSEGDEGRTKGGLREPQR